MIKLYNKSKLSDSVLKPILKSAYKQAGLKGDVIVKFENSIVGGGYAESAWGVYKDFWDLRRIVINL
ncbi:MAG TPA: hypothetical protein DC057_14380 [Spirochaetia bacterium]|nr:hypothetical protein [Spirochaetia bacterium]